MSQSRLEKIQAALAAAKIKGGGEKKDYPRVSEITWKPKIGDNVVRLVLKEDQELPYFLVRYYDFGVLEKYPILSPNTYGKFTDPIQKECYELRNAKGENAAESAELSKKFRTQEKYFFPVIVRGEESKGVQMWEVTTKKLDQVTNLFNIPKIGDIADYKEGRDLTINCKEGTFPDRDGVTRKYPEIVSVLPDFVTSPLGTDEEIQTWSNAVPDVYKYYSSKTDEELKELFEKKVCELLGIAEDEEQAQEEKTQDVTAPNPTTEPVKVEVKEVITKGGGAKVKDVPVEDNDFEKMFDDDGDK